MLVIIPMYNLGMGSITLLVALHALHHQAFLLPPQCHCHHETNLIMVLCPSVPSPSFRASPSSLPSLTYLPPLLALAVTHQYQVACRIAHTPFKYPGSGGGSLCARWVGTHQHPAIPNFDSKIGYRLLDF